MCTLIPDLKFPKNLNSHLKSMMRLSDFTPLPLKAVNFRLLDLDGKQYDYQSGAKAGCAVA